MCQANLVLCCTPRPGVGKVFDSRAAIGPKIEQGVPGQEQKDGAKINNV